jgi:hypothetical protein
VLFDLLAVTNSLHWTSGDITGMPPGTQVHSVLYASGHWFAVGGYAGAGAFYNSLPLVLTGQDGAHWPRMDTSAMGNGEITAATVDSGGHPVLVGSAPRPNSKPNTRTVLRGSIWVGNGTTTGWKRGGLGCKNGGHPRGRARADRGQPGPLALSKPGAGARSRVLISSRGRRA